MVALAALVISTTGLLSYAHPLLNLLARLVKMGRRIGSFEAHNSFESRRNNNLSILTKVLHKRITSGIVIIGPICKKAANRMPKLIERHHKSDWIADIFFCQISTNNFSTIRSNTRHNLRKTYVWAPLYTYYSIIRLHQIFFALQLRSLLFAGALSSFSVKLADHWLRAPNLKHSSIIVLLGAKRTLSTKR